MKLTLPRANGTMVDVHVCDAKDDDHLAVPRLATSRCFWPTAEGDEHDDGVEYCEPCADWMRKVAKAMGFKLHSVPIPKPDLPDANRRAIALEGVPTK